MEYTRAERYILISIEGNPPTETIFQDMVSQGITDQWRLEVLRNDAGQIRRVLLHSEGVMGEVETDVGTTHLVWDFHRYRLGTARWSSQTAVFGTPGVDYETVPLAPAWWA